MDDSQHNRRLTRNIAWNFVRIGMPLVLALITIPQLIAMLGTARFGVLTLVWMVVGYFSVFDLGLGQSLTKLVAERIDSEKQDEMPFLVQPPMTTTSRRLRAGSHCVSNKGFAGGGESPVPSTRNSGKTRCAPPQRWTAP